MSKRVINKISLNNIWIIISLFILFISTGYTVVTYSIEHNKILEHEKKDLILILKGFNYELSLMIQRNGIESAQEYIDAKVLLSESFKSISILKKDYVILSSNRNYLGKLKNEFDFVNLQYLSGDEKFYFDKAVFLKFTDKKNTFFNNQYCLLIEFSNDYHGVYLQNTIVYYIASIILFSALLMAMIFVFYKMFVIKPIHTINQKIISKDFVYSNFFVREIDAIDENLVNSAKEINSSLVLLDSLINSIKDLIFYKDKYFRYMGCNEAFLKFVGKTKEQVIGCEDFELFDKEMATLFREMDILMLQENHIRINDEWVTYPDGHKVYLQTQKVPFLYNETEIGILGISRDITVLHNIQKKLKRQTYIDTLTKLNNRKSYNKKIDELIALNNRYDAPFSMLMYDIDDFKSINDTYGHNIGDEVLMKMSEKIKSILRENDHIFRIGGEEFVILFPETTLEDANKVACKIKDAVENQEIINNKTITISIGLAQAQKNETEDSLFQRVDKLLYHSKRTGKNRVSF